MIKRMSSSLRIVAMVGIIPVLLAAAKTKTVESTDGKRPAAQERPHRILVLVMSPDPATRSSVEDVIAGELSMSGAKAIASHVPFPELPKERAPFERELVAQGFDAVTVSRPVSRDDKLQWVDGETSYTPSYAGMDWWGGYWYTFEAVSIPGYLEKETKVRVRTDLWRTTGTKEGSLAWSGTSELVDPVTIPQAARDVGAGVAKALRKAKLI
jgi:hypothetical protein